MTDLNKEAEKGNNAKRIIEDQAFLDAVSNVTSAVMFEWENETKTARREELWLHQKVIKSVVNNLYYAMENGEIAKNKLDTINKKGFFN